MDTNIISYILRNDETVINRYRQESGKGNEFVMLPIVYYEVSRWLLEKNAKRLRAEFNDLCTEIPLIGTGREVWDKAAVLYVQTRRDGRFIGGDADLLIAAFCIRLLSKLRIRRYKRALDRRDVCNAKVISKEVYC